MKVKVKICGIRSFKTAKAAIDGGADFLGFNFVPTSKRYIKPELAKKIINKLDGKIKVIGVFQNETMDYVNQIIDSLKLDFVQLHEKKIIKNTKNETAYHLVDRKVQGFGHMPDLDKAAALAKKSKIFFAGGLNPKNVTSIIKKIKPFAVDVASGIETNGLEDINKIKEFIFNAKEAVI